LVYPIRLNADYSFDAFPLSTSFLEPIQLVAECQLFNPENNRSLAGKKVLITAGPTREEIDPVRYLSNHSSGKMGFEIARAAHLAGAEVTLIAGPVSIETQYPILRINVTSALQMHQQVLDHIEGQDVFIGCAAVADYRVNKIATDKIKKNDQQLVLTMVENPDIITSVSGLENKPYCVGFAAETTELIAHAKKKIVAKNLDMICANDVSDSDIGFNVDNNKLTVITKDSQQIELAKTSKRLLAVQLIGLISEQL